MRKDCWIRGEGPLVPFAEGFRDWMLGLGHPWSSLKHYLVLMGQFNRWLVTEGIELEALTPGAAERFLRDRQAAGYAKTLTLASLEPMFDHLRQKGALTPAPPEPTARESLLNGYRRHLIHDRGLTETTVRRYEGFARRFLTERAARTGSETGTEGLTSVEVNSFMLEATGRLVVDSAKREAADLRALLRYLYLADVLEVDLGAAMPPVAAWRGRSLPQTMSAADVDRLLAGCDRTTVSGRRDFSVLVLLARLGLRSGEVAALELGDVDWRAGEIIVRGKARRKDRLPRPEEVGEALVEYLRTADRRACTRQLVLSLYAPLPADPSELGHQHRLSTPVPTPVSPGVGGHRLRHALATEMLRQGGDLLEIAQVLRQSDLGTTAGYAKVDRVALRASRPWPGVRS